MREDAEAAARKAEEVARDVLIPPCPTILTKLLREARADEPDLRRIDRFVTGDVGLAAAVLNVVNSSFYALRTKLSSVHQAVAMLGVNAVVQLVRGLLLRQAFPNAKGRAIEQYWRRSTATALIAALLLRETRRADPEAAHTYVLFRDCGMPILQQAHRDYADIFDGSALAAGAPVLELENARYGTDHCRVGARLARRWQLSDALGEAILHHHGAPDTVCGSEARLLIGGGLVAERLYCDATGQRSGQAEDVEAWALPLLGLKEAQLSEFCARIRPSLV